MSDSHASNGYRDLNECRKPSTSHILAAPATYGHSRRKLEVIITLHKNVRTENFPETGQTLVFAWKPINTGNVSTAAAVHSASALDFAMKTVAKGIPSICALICVLDCTTPNSYTWLRVMLYILLYNI